MFNSSETLENLLSLHADYYRVKRMTIPKEQARLSGKDVDEVDLRDESVRESLMTHVGHCPIIASFIYPHLEDSSKDSVNLGKALTMLSIHDIGETISGDKIFFAKTQADEDIEVANALKLLPEMHHDLYLEFTANQTPSANFANMIDRISPMLCDVESPELTARRFMEMNYGSKEIRDKCEPHFTWDTNMVALFEEFVKRFDEIEGLVK